MTPVYSNICTFDTLVLKVMDLILLGITAVPIIVTSPTGISAVIIRKNITWPINKLKPSRSFRAFHILVIEQDLILSNIVKGLQRPLLIYHILEHPTRLMKIRRFWNFIMVCRIIPQLDAILTQKMSGMSYRFPNRISLNYKKSQR